MNINHVSKLGSFLNKATMDHDHFPPKKSHAFVRKRVKSANCSSGSVATWRY